MYKQIYISNLLSKLFGCINSIQWPGPLKYLIYPVFCKFLGISMQQAKITSFKQYKTCRDIFTRQLDSQYRPLSNLHQHIVSPCDSVCETGGVIQNNQVLQIKNRPYSVNDFVRQDIASTYENGQYMTLYLSPKDCHLLFSPCDGMITEISYIPGALYPVNALFRKLVPTLFVTNERVVIKVSLGHDTFYMVLVGALNVGCMDIDCLPELKTNALASRQYRRYSLNHKIKKGERFGQFNLGSTVVMLFPPKMISNALLTPPSSIRYGEPIAELSVKNEYETLSK